MEKVILDCDPGHDDAIAILLAAGDPAIDLLGVTTVAGNQTIDKVTRNALSVCAAFGIEVPVARGAEGPLVASQVVAEDIHGETGLDGPTLPDPTFALDPRPAAEFLVDTVMAHDPGTVTLVPVGPFTNIALAIRLEPRIVERVKRVIVMGGAHTRGNVTPAAEFNIYADPEAAEAVFRADWDVTMIGLDLTHQALATPELQERVRAVGGSISNFVLDIWEFVGGSYRATYDFAAAPVHDACCIAALIDPSMVTTALADVRVELRGEFTRGMTVTNFEDEPGMHHRGGGSTSQTDYRTRVATRIDAGRFDDAVVAAVRTLSARQG